MEAAEVAVSVRAAVREKVAVKVVAVAVRVVARILDTEMVTGSATTKRAGAFRSAYYNSSYPNKEEIIMPGFDRSGPMGAGPMTGGRRGLCGGAYGHPSAFGAGVGRGQGLRRGYRRGRCVGYAEYGGYAYPPAAVPAYPVSRADEMAMLRAEANAMKASLDSVQNRIAELEKEASE